MKQFLFVLSATESYTIPASSFKYAQYLSNTTVALYFNIWRNGVEGSATVTLTVTSVKANDVVSAIASQVGNSNTSVFRYDAVNSKYFTTNVTGITSVAATTGSGGFNLLDGDGTSVLIDLGKEVKVVEGTGIDVDWTDTSTGSAADPYDLTISCDLEGTELKSTGETGGNKFLREDGDGTCSWQAASTVVTTKVSINNASVLDLKYDDTPITLKAAEADKIIVPVKAILVATHAGSNESSSDDLRLGWSASDSTTSQYWASGRDWMNGVSSGTVSSSCSGNAAPANNNAMTFSITNKPFQVWCTDVFNGGWSMDVYFSYYMVDA